MTDAPDPYGFFGHLDRDVIIIGCLCAFLILAYVVFGNVLLLIMAVIGIIGMIAVQSVRNNRRRQRYKYEPNIASVEDH